MKGSKSLKNIVLNTIFGSCPVDMSDADIMDAMKSIPGYLYVLIPAGVGPLIMLAVALLVNNLPRNRRYPEFWL